MHYKNKLFLFAQYNKMKVESINISINSLLCVLISIFMIICVIFILVKFQYAYEEEYISSRSREGFTQFIPPILSQFIPPSFKRAMHPRSRKMRLYLEKKYGENNIALNRFLRKSGFY